MQTARLRIGIIHSAIGCAVALMVCGVPSAWAQEKQKISYKVTADNSKYTQRKHHRRRRRTRASIDRVRNSSNVSEQPRP